MKKISIIGNSSIPLKMFILELAWVISKNKKTYCHIEDEKFYNCFSENDLDVTDISNLTIIKNRNELIENSNPDNYLISDKFMEDAEFIIFVVEQNIFSINYINKFAEYENLPKIALVYLDFISSNFDEEYMKKFAFNDKISENILSEFYFEFDERTKSRQVENQFNRIINLKKYPKDRKKNLFNLSKTIFKDDENLGYKEYFKELDGRVSVC